MIDSAVWLLRLSMATVSTPVGIQGAILNQNLSINSADNPARRGDVIVLYATGEGATMPLFT